MDRTLEKYLPKGATDYIHSLLDKYAVHLAVSSKRKTKNGDYRPPVQYPTHRISINESLSCYAFLITLIHELAHAYAWELNHSLKNPHGELWKRCFRELMLPMLQQNIFPEDIRIVLTRHLANPKATSGSDITLVKTLMKYDENNIVTIGDIPENTQFVFNGSVFIKLHKLRKFYLCKEIRSQRKYRISEIAEISLL